MRKVRGGIAFTLFVLASAACAEVYRWVDAEGKVHFGDRPPLEAEAKDVSGELKPINSADATKPQNASISQRPNQIEQQYEQRKQQQQLQQQQQMARACNEARRQLRILRGPVYFVDGEGKEVQISERERQQRAEQLQQEIARVCG